MIISMLTLAQMQTLYSAIWRIWSPLIFTPGFGIGHPFRIKPIFESKANGMLTIPSESMRTFEGHTSGDFTPPQTATAPTIIGDRESVVLHGSDTMCIVFSLGASIYINCHWVRLNWF
jgi:hypothetical protein